MSQSLCILTPREALPVPTGASPQMSVRNQHPILAFDDTAIEQAQWHGVMPSYYNKAYITFTFYLVFNDTDPTHKMYFSVRFEKISEETEDIDSDSSVAAMTKYVSCPITSGTVRVFSVAVGWGDVDLIQPGEMFRLFFTRNAGPFDTAVGDVEILFIELSQP